MKPHLFVKTRAFRVLCAALVIVIVGGIVRGCFIGELSGVSSHTMRGR